METHRPILIEELSPSLLKERWGIHYLDRLEFPDPSTLQWVERSCLKRLRKEHLRKTNLWTSLLHETSFRARKFPSLYLKWVNPLVRYGVFACSTISPLTLVAEYTGVVRKRRRFKDAHNDYIFGYVVGPYETPYVIDARERGNISRFINHSDEPNLTSRWMILDGICHIIFFANKAILKGEQLTYDYGVDYWRRRTAPLTL